MPRSEFAGAGIERWNLLPNGGREDLDNPGCIPYMVLLWDSGPEPIGLQNQLDPTSACWHRS